MKTGLIFILFFFFTLLISLSNQTDKQRKYSDMSSFQITDVSSNVCEIVSISFSFKKLFPELIFSQLRDEKLIEHTYTCRLKLAETYQHNIKALVFSSIRQRPFRSKLLFTSKKDDSHHLFT